MQHDNIKPPCCRFADSACLTLTSQYVSSTHTGMIVATSTAAYVSGAGVIVTTNNDKTGYGSTATQAVICNTVTSDLGVKM